MRPIKKMGGVMFNGLIQINYGIQRVPCNCRI